METSQIPVTLRYHVGYEIKISQLEVAEYDGVIFDCWDLGRQSSIRHVYLREYRSAHGALSTVQTWYNWQKIEDFAE